MKIITMKTLIAGTVMALGFNMQAQTTWNTLTNYPVTGDVTVYWNTGDVAVGTVVPSQKFEVAGGNIHISNSGYGLMMQGNRMLFTDASQSSIYLGNSTGPFSYGASNSFLGTGTGYHNTSGASNTFVGNNAGIGNTTGSNNTLVGYESGNNSSTYSNICAFGNQALYSSYASNNSAFGYEALYSNTSGTPNHAFGYQALYNNTTGTNNNAFGAGALGANSTGNGNVGFGDITLYNNTGSNNTAIGYFAGGTYAGGSNNTFLGFEADASANSFSNATAIGYQAITNASNRLYLGNSSALTYCALGVWSGSDSRFKNNVTENVKGLAFIKKLRPVTYNFDSKKLDEFLTQNMPADAKAKRKKEMDFTTSTAVIRSGFIAQEVEQAAKEVGYTSDIVHAPENTTDHYALNYAEFVVPLVKGMQEQQDMIDSLKQQVAQLTKLVSANNGNINGSNTNSTSAISTQNVNLSDADVVVLNQNQPNPFAEQTLVTYNIPQSANSAQILFYDMNGKQINSVTVNTKGKGALNVYANDLSNGTYSYTLVVDGKVIDTKKMIKQQ